MARVSAAAVVAALTLFSGSAAACEWHEMMAYGYGNYSAPPQRYSPFARAHQTPVEPAPESEAESEQAATPRTGQDQAVEDAGTERRDQQDAGNSESVLAQRR